MSSPDAVFAGRVAEGYDRLMVPLLFEAFAAAVPPRLPRLEAGHVLETAAGTGVATAAMAAALPAAVAITATDLNQPMLDRAALRLPAGRVALRQADAQALPFEDAAFDALVCQFGLMFMPDKPRALAEARRVLRPGGRVLVSVWTAIERNPIAALVQEAVAGAFPDDPPLFMARTPHGHGDIGAMTGLLEAAGFADVAAERVTLTCRAPSARQAATALCQGTPLRAEIEARRVPGLDAVTEIAAQALARRLAAGAMNVPVGAPMEAVFFSATKKA